MSHYLILIPFGLGQFAAIAVAQNNACLGCFLSYILGACQLATHIYAEKGAQ